jgi:hypothetical protein
MNYGFVVLLYVDQTAIVWFRLCLALFKVYSCLSIIACVLNFFLSKMRIECCHFLLDSVQFLCRLHCSVMIDAELLVSGSKLSVFWFLFLKARI